MAGAALVPRAKALSRTLKPWKGHPGEKGRMEKANVSGLT